MQKLNSNLTRRISFLSTTLALTPLVAFLSLTLAPSIVLDNTNTVSASSTLTLSATVDPVLSMSVATYNPSTSTYDPTIKNIVMEIPHGTTSTLTSRILTSTNNATGYTLSFKDTDNITDLAPATSTGSTITPVSPNTPLSSFNDNTWGYAVQTTTTSAPEPSTPTTYNPVSTTSTAIYDTSSPSSEYHYFTVAAKVGDTLTAGSYSDQVVFSLVANQLPYAPDFFNTEYMQDFTTQICNTVVTPLASTTDVTADNGADYYVTGSHPTKVPSTKVKDKRDEQEYTIRKLADGNCWMTENLRLGKEGAITLDSTNSNMVAGRTFNLPAADTVPGKTWESQQEYPFVFYYETRSDVSPSGPASLYNWYTATAGARNSSGNSLMTASSGQAVDSVCPKNWQLPIDGYSTTNKSYPKIAYIYTNANDNSAAYIDSNPEQAAINEVRINTLLSLPTSFTYTGDYIHYSGRLSTSHVGHFWTSTKSSGIDAYNFYYETTGDERSLYLWRRNDRGRGFAVRCVLAS